MINTQKVQRQLFIFSSCLLKNDGTNWISFFRKLNSYRTILLFTFTIILILFSACDDQDVRVIYSIQGVGPPENEAAISNFMQVYVIGKGFGAESGRLVIGDREIVVSEWGPNRIRFHLNGEENWAYGKVKVFVNDPEGEIELQGPDLIPFWNMNGENPLRSAYFEYIDSFAVSNGLENNPDFPGWVDWMKSEGDNFSPLHVYSRAYQRQLIEHKSIRISYNYHNDIPLELRRPWPIDFERNDVDDDVWDQLQELEHMSKVKQLLEASFPTYGFQLIKDLDPHEADIVVFANANRNYTRGPVSTSPIENYTTIVISLDFNLSHEIGHFLLGWFDHHCYALDCNAVPAGRNMPPTTQEPQFCTMDQNGGYWCNACAAGLGIPLDRFDIDRYQIIKRQFNGRYAVNRP